MAARNRPRNGLAKEDRDDAHEERSMWEQIIRDLEKCKAINDRAKEVTALILEKEEIVKKYPSVKENDELQDLYREGVRLAEEEQKMLNEEPADLIKNLGILAALRTASEQEPARQTAPPKRSKPKAPKVELDGIADSPVPSPSVASSASRLKGNSARSGSVASTRDGKEGSSKQEVMVKIEEVPSAAATAGPATGGAEGSKGPLTFPAGKLVVGAEVAYKQAKMKEDGSQWIQCIVISITDSNGRKRYDVQDPEPDENGAPGQIYYKTSAATLIPIPTIDIPLPDYPVGKAVLARYPETTTFYRAEVTGVTRKGFCKLKFEDDQNQEMEVDRRFVLEWSQK